jgi:hypothetical protein
MAVDLHCWHESVIYGDSSMKIIESTPARTASAMGVALIVGVMVACPAHAQDRRHREAGEQFRTPHMVFDNRYRHGHYYPAVGYSVGVLPPGYLSVGFGNRRLFFHGGVWFRPAAAGYVVVRPPFGVVVPVLPPAYSTVWMAGAPYYYANDVYYVEAPGGYAVAAPPAGIEQGTVMQDPAAPMAAPAPAAPPAPPAASAPSQPAAANWYYCESSKTYYPYVSECREGWRQVPATPPGAR